jgi:hypothetical protein
MSKWWHMSRVRLTPQYLSGICAGTGLGLILGSHISLSEFLIVITGGCLVAVGATCALAAQKNERTQNSCQTPGPAN